jgi:hypothetical protein
MLYWKTAIVKRKLGEPVLEKYHLEIDREPYFCTFIQKINNFKSLFHAITKEKCNRKLKKYFKFLPGNTP